MRQPFTAGQVVTVFRSRLRDDATPGYAEEADALLTSAREQPGFVDFKHFTAEDGERVSIVTFADAESQAAWRADPRHHAAQERGRSDWYAEYSVQVAACVAVHQFALPQGA